MRIAIIAYDKISPFMLSTPLAVFGEPFVGNRHEVMICGETQRVAAIGGLSIDIPYPLSQADDAEVVILPGWRHVDEAIPVAIIDVIRRAAMRGAMVAGLCLGAFALAEAGLLDGRRATTHWSRLDVFQSRYPHIQIDKGAIFVDEGMILTSAGIASAMDCCLHILARLSGSTEANRVARHLVVPVQRGGGQPQVIERPTAASSAERRVAKMLDDLLVDPTGNPTLDELAQRTGMSRRSLSRYIRAHTGDSLGAWLRRARVALAQDLFLKGADGLDQIAGVSGFSDAKSLRHAFRMETGMTPKQWQTRHRLS
ncbi:helix-turn-helix domain-containing protein [Rhizobiales bacterium RZME27]|uniref:Helix-turn-helix domain-containing protein n=1 Tax=Endobacterium cereale TaxID=2663029 RepID=A0A6A8ADR2_9HYPH|nr:helix-turn-helix domain-containing protein [Endobacterium cereale]MEB2848454.1 helix-turn-helix domain-containing protein [Endobacterium cereale]MQY48058.1 helix-turn-helix domain-containing protein [Endobacterium cereale]